MTARSNAHPVSPAPAPVLDAPAPRWAEPATGPKPEPTVVAPSPQSSTETFEQGPIADRGEAAPRPRLGVLRHPHYRSVWLGALVSSVGGWMEIVGVQWLMAEQTRSALWLGYLAVAQLAPMLVLGMWGGLVADRVNRKRLLLITQAIMMAIAAGLAAAAWMGRATPAVLIALGGLNGVTMAFNVPAWQVLTPRLVPRDELTAAINLNGLQFNLARVLGPALGGVLMALYGPTVLFVVNSLSFLGVIGAIARTPDAPAPPLEPTTAWQRTREALSFVFHRRGPRAVFLAMVAFAMLAAPLVRLLSLFVSDVYAGDDWISRTAAAFVPEAQVKEAVFGVLWAVMGLGAVVGVLLLRFIPRWYPKHHLIPMSVAGSGLSIVGFAATTWLPMAAGVMFAAGVFWLWAFNTSFAAMQILVDDRMRGRVLSVCNVAVFGAMPLGSVLAGAIGGAVAGHAGTGVATQIGVGAMGLVLTVVGLIMLTWRTPEIDGVREGDPAWVRRPGLLAGVTARAHRPRRS